MLTDEQKSELNELVNGSLDNAEKIWNDVGHEFSRVVENMEKIALAFSNIPTQIPGHPIIREDASTVDQFIAMIVDMRNSTKHLMSSISSRITQVNMLQRVFYETSALLPCVAKVISFEKGRVTEYLGDGVLALFHASEKKIPGAIYESHRAAKNCLIALNDIINPCLRSRYNLPEIEIGIGLSMSKAIVTVIGLPENRQPKVFGECVFRASKLSHGKNEIYIDKIIEKEWPKVKGGTLSLIPKMFGDTKGYLIREN